MLMLYGWICPRPSTVFRMTSLWMSWQPIAFVSACKLLASYLSNRKQRVQLGDNYSDWSEIIKGVPQGSILGRLVFNVFINGMFYFVKKSSIYNYVDDNTLPYSNKILQTTMVVLENESTDVIGWFIGNKMQANPDKFQAIMLGKLDFENCKSLNICGSTIQCEGTVKLLGVTFDYMLNFEAHIANICMRQARQINVLLRLSNVLNPETKILIYKSFIYSYFNYCPLAWHFCSKASTEKLEICNTEL